MKAKLKNKKCRICRRNRNIQGFTLVEMMLALFISSIIISAVYGVYVAQQKIYRSQEQVVEVQQNIRTALYILSSELRMAGFHLSEADALNTENSAIYVNSGSIVTNSPLITNELTFRADLDEDGTPDDENEDITYSLYTCTVNNKSTTCLGRKDGSGSDIQISQNFDAMEFEYLDENGDNLGSSDDIATDTRAIRITLLAKAGREAPDNLPNKITYRLPSGDKLFSDKIRRRLQVTTVNLRNMGTN